MKTLLVEKNLGCPFCGHSLKNGDVMYEDEYRGEIVQEIIMEEGENGRFLK